MNETGIKLLIQIASGSENAMKEFYQLFSSSVYGYAIKHLQSPEDATEILSQVMVEVWRFAERFEGKSKVTTWLLGIARHKILDLLRKKSRHQHVQSLEETENVTDIESDEETPFELTLGSENAEFVRQCLDKLTDNQKDIVHLTFYEGLSYPDIADVVGIPTGTVKSRMHQAKAALKKCLEAFLGKD